MTFIIYYSIHCSMISCGSGGNEARCASRLFIDVLPDKILLTICSGDVFVSDSAELYSISK